MKELAPLEDVLRRNYKALGFSLVSYRLVRDDEGWETYVQGQIQRPCGGFEAFSFRVPDLYVKYQKDLIENLARSILGATASKQHLEKDVEDGTLPPFDIDKHVFKGTLI